MMGKTRYVSWQRKLLPYKKLFINKFKKENNIDYSSEEVIVGVGGKTHTL